MTKFFRALSVVTGLSLVSGCAVEQPDVEEHVGETQGAIITDNSLVLNALVLNALVLNALVLNALVLNGADAGVLTSLAEDASTGEANRQVLHYMVGCALTPSQSVTYTYTDATGLHSVTERGAIGLAPQWATGRLDEAGKRLVSACLAARANYYGIPVDLSLRADVDVLEQNTSPYELGLYNRIEGAFWGNLFSETPYIRSCYKPENVAHSRAKLRDCAAGHLNADGSISECGMLQIVGPCTDVCRRLYKYGGYYTQCDVNSDGDATDLLITVGLK